MERTGVKHVIQNVSFLYYLLPYFLQRKIVEPDAQSGWVEQLFSYLRKLSPVFDEYHSYIRSENSAPLEDLIRCAAQLTDFHGEGNIDFQKWNEKEYEPLQSVFSALFGHQGDTRSYQLRPLSLNHLFPESKIEMEKADTLFLHFLDELKKVKHEIQLLSLMEKYFWCVASNQSPDISLYDEMKTTAAIAVCLYEQWLHGDLSSDILKEIKKRHSPDFLLIQGDISGIQSFIFNIPSKGAAKSLKGRSVYIGLLPEVIARHLLDRLNLPLANLLYCGGGNFFILAPNQVKKQFETLRKSILENLLQAHSGEVYLVLESVSFSPAEFGNFTEIWDQVIAKTNRLKKRKFSELGLETSFEKIFGPLDDGSEEANVCKVCGSFGSKHPVKTDAERGEVCSLCDSFTELTDQLKNANYIVFGKNVSGTKKGTYQEIFSRFGYHVEFASRKPAGQNVAEEYWYKLNDTDFLDEGCAGFQFGAYRLPSGENGIATFEELSERAVIDERGDKKLAHLKMDVDNLGSLFGMGLGKGRSPAKVSAISRMLHLYFCGYINQLIKEKGWQDYLYVVFSGGDDTYIVGTWRYVFDFTEAFYQGFRKYTGENPLITLSAGINVFPYTYPVIRAAEITEDALETAKDTHQEPNDGHEPPKKNRISFLGEVFNWEEFKRIRKIEGILQKMVEIYGRNVLFKVEKSTLGFKNILRDSLNGRYRHIKFWRLAYYLREIKHDYENSLKGKAQKPKEDLAQSLIDQYREIVIHNLFRPENRDQIHQIMIIPAAIRWAELATRKVKEDEHD